MQVVRSVRIISIGNFCFTAGSCKADCEKEKDSFHIISFPNIIPNPLSHALAGKLPIADCRLQIANCLLAIAILTSMQALSDRYDRCHAVFVRSGMYAMNTRYLRNPCRGLHL